MKLQSQRIGQIIQDNPVVQELDLIHKNINLLQNFRFKEVYKNYSASIDDDLILLKNSGLSVTLPIRGLFKGFRILVKDVSGSVSSSNSTIYTGTSATIDGGATVTISTDYVINRLLYDGTNWFTW